MPGRSRRWADDRRGARSWTVARPEFLHAVRSKAFIIGVAAAADRSAASRRSMPKFAGDESTSSNARSRSSIARGRLYPMLSLRSPTHWNAAQVAKDGTREGAALPRSRNVEGGRPAADDDARSRSPTACGESELFAFVELPPALLTGRARGALLHRQPDLPAAAALARAGRRPAGHAPQRLPAPNVDAADDRWRWCSDRS